MEGLLKKEEKKQRADAIKKRKLEREPAKVQKEKNKRRKKTKPIYKESKNGPSTFEQIKCTACHEELNSDKEDEDNKNIGCHNCSNWFHLRLTDIFG